jgi:hypothetical protein
MWGATFVCQMRIPALDKDGAVAIAAKLSATKFFPEAPRALH